MTLDDRWNTAAALPRILDGLAHRGYRTVTVADRLDGE
jgi:peptidoglycan/xylan/chitin deacetylase (PgdA/CDA1 family)